MLLELFFSITIISLVSLVGAFALSINKKTLEKSLDALVSLSVGALLGGAFLHLLPEVIEHGSIETSFVFVLMGIIIFFVLEKFVQWHHCHKTEHTELTFSYMNLIGDAIHNFLDGVLLAGTFSINTQLGITTAIAIIAHEIPQEIGDFGVLIKGGFTRKKALLANFLISLTTFAGAIITLIASQYIQGITSLLVAITAGGFIYIASSDLIPELHKNSTLKDALTQIFFIILGISLIALVMLLELH